MGTIFHHANDQYTAIIASDTSGKVLATVTDKKANSTVVKTVRMSLIIELINSVAVSALKNGKAKADQNKNAVLDYLVDRCKTQSTDDFII